MVKGCSSFQRVLVLVLMTGLCVALSNPAWADPEVTQQSYSDKDTIVTVTTFPANITKSGKTPRTIRIKTPQSEVLEVDLNGDGVAQYREFKRPPYDVLFSEPSSQGYQKMVVDKRIASGKKRGILHAEFVLDRDGRNYKLYAKSFVPYRVYGDNVNCPPSTNTAPIVQGGVTPQVMNAIQKDSQIDDSCRKGDFAKDLPAMKQAIDNVMKSASGPQKAGLACLMSHNLGLYAGKIQHEFDDAPSSVPKSNPISSASQDPACQGDFTPGPVVQCQPPLLWGDVGEYNDCNGKITFNGIDPSMSDKVNYDQVFFHESLHKAGIKDEPTVIHIVDCCMKSDSAACKLVDSQIKTEADAKARLLAYSKNLPGFSKLSSFISEHVGIQAVTSLFDNFFSQLQSLRSSKMKEVKACRAADPKNTDQICLDQINVAKTIKDKIDNFSDKDCKNFIGESKDHAGRSLCEDFQQGISQVMLDNLNKPCDTKIAAVNNVMGSCLYAATVDADYLRDTMLNVKNPEISQIHLGYQGLRSPLLPTPYPTFNLAGNGGSTSLSIDFSTMPSLSNFSGGGINSGGALSPALVPSGGPSAAPSNLAVASSGASVAVAKPPGKKGAAPVKLSQFMFDSTVTTDPVSQSEAQTVNHFIGAIEKEMGPWIMKDWQNFVESSNASFVTKTFANIIEHIGIHQRTKGNAGSIPEMIKQCEAKGKPAQCGQTVEKNIETFFAEKISKSCESHLITDTPEASKKTLELCKQMNEKMLKLIRYSVVSNAGPRGGCKTAAPKDHPELNIRATSSTPGYNFTCLFSSLTDFEDCQAHPTENKCTKMKNGKVQFNSRANFEVLSPEVLQGGVAKNVSTGATTSTDIHNTSGYTSIHFDPDTITGSKKGGQPVQLGDQAQAVVAASNSATSIGNYVGNYVDHAMNSIGIPEAQAAPLPQTPQFSSSQGTPKVGQKNDTADQIPNPAALMASTAPTYSSGGAGATGAGGFAGGFVPPVQTPVSFQQNSYVQSPANESTDSYSDTDSAGASAPRHNYGSTNSNFTNFNSGARGAAAQPVVPNSNNYGAGAQALDDSSSGGTNLATARAPRDLGSISSSINTSVNGLDAGISQGVAQLPGQLPSQSLGQNTQPSSAIGSGDYSQSTAAAVSQASGAKQAVSQGRGAQAMGGPSGVAQSTASGSVGSNAASSSRSSSPMEGSLQSGSQSDSAPEAGDSPDSSLANHSATQTQNRKQARPNRSPASKSSSVKTPGGLSAPGALSANDYTRSVLDFLRSDPEGALNALHSGKLSTSLKKGHVRIFDEKNRAQGPKIALCVEKWSAQSNSFKMISDNPQCSP